MCIRDREYFPALREALEATSCETLQMRGTVGGNLLQDTRCLFYNQSEFWRRAKGPCVKTGGDSCHVTGSGRCLSNYASDLAPSLLTLGASLRLIGPEGEREITLEELFSGDGAKPFNLKPGEILCEILLPKRVTKGGYEKLRLRGSIDYPLLGVALSMADGKGRLSVGAVGPKPTVWDFESEGIDLVAEKAPQGLQAIGNTVLDPSYRRNMAEVFSRRLIQRVLKGGQ